MVDRRSSAILNNNGDDQQRQQHQRTECCVFGKNNSFETNTMGGTIAVEIRPGRGRCAIYRGSRPVQPGEVVLANVPIATRIVARRGGGGGGALTNKPHYCAYCCAGVTKNNPTVDGTVLFKRCGRCQRNIYYCSRRCQKQDWTIGRHKFECDLLRSKRWQHLFFEEEEDVDDDDDGGRHTTSNNERYPRSNFHPAEREQALDDICLLVRTILYVHHKDHVRCKNITAATRTNSRMTNVNKNKNQDNPATIITREGNVPLLQCGKMHWDSMCHDVDIFDNNNSATVRYRTKIAKEVCWAIQYVVEQQQASTSTSNTTLLLIDHIDEQYVLTSMRKFHANNFSLYNDLIVEYGKHKMYLGRIG